MRHSLQSTLPKHVQLELDLAEPLANIEADASQIQQVVMNLMINAAESVSEDTQGNVRVATNMAELDMSGAAFGPGELTPGKYVVLTVQDNGCGMDEDTKARIFDPFFSTKFTGRGLGLAAVLGIVRSHRGALEVASVPGKGSTFTVMFPATEGEVTAPAAAKPRAVELAERDLTSARDRR